MADLSPHVFLKNSLSRDHPSQKLRCPRLRSRGISAQSPRGGSGRCNPMADMTGHGMFHSLPEATEPSGVAAGAACARRPQGTADCRSDSAMIAARRKYVEYSEKGSEKFSRQNFCGIPLTRPDTGEFDDFGITRNVVEMNLQGSERATHSPFEDSKPLSPMHSAEGFQS